MATVGVLGGGSWGTALANLLAKKGFQVDFWIHNPKLAKIIKETRENPFYMPDFLLSKNLIPTSNLEEVVQKKDFLLSVIPSHVLREVMSSVASFLEPRTIILNGTKGIEENSLKLVDEILKEALPIEHHSNLCYLCGPSFAKEVVEELPTGVIVASLEEKISQKIQQLLSTPYFRVYTTQDVRGALIGGALKNVIAIATGISDGLGLGLNSRSALITRGLAEIIRLGNSLNADSRTLSGLGGMGDLVLTCTGNLSRNRTVGFRLGQGESFKEIVREMKMVAEGVKTTHSAYQLSKKLKVEMPIVNKVYEILYENKKPKQAIQELMSRPLKAE